MPADQRPDPQVRRRAADRGWLCWVAARASQAWDWVDRRQIDAHVVNAVTLCGTINITTWAMKFAEHGDRPGIEVAAIIAAVTAPWAALQAAMVRFVFDARKTSFEVKP
jgi:hypothetical protein